MIIDNEEFHETTTLNSYSDKFEITKHTNSDFDSWIEFYKHSNPDSFASWDNASFTYDAHRILHNYIYKKSIQATDLDKFNMIMEDVKKDDLEELYRFLTKAIELNYFTRQLNK